MKSSLQEDGYISPNDLDLVTVTHGVNEAVEVILDYQRRVGTPETVPTAFA